MFITTTFTPLFNTPDFLQRLEKSPVDQTHHIRILETFIFPKQKVTILKKEGDVVTITCEDYPSILPLYTLSKFLEEGKEVKKPPLPSISEVIDRLICFPKIPYLLGGTIPEKVNFNLRSSSIPFYNRHRLIYGIDCSGLLYFVTNGHTPRNTKELMEFGKKVENLHSLDLIVFKGHVIIYLGDGFVIESRKIDGVIISKWEDRKNAISEPYHFIRFHPEAFLEK